MKYKVGDILKSKYDNNIEIIISGVNNKNEECLIADRWANEKDIDREFILVTQHECETEPKETEYKPWRANKHEKYWFLNGGGITTFAIEEDDLYDNYHYASGNYFETKEKAENYKDYLLAKQTLKNDAKGFVPNWNNPFEAKWLVYLNGLLKTEDNYNAKDMNLAFATKEDAQESMYKHEKEWQIVLNWENGKK
jgi:hypothetical protein